MSSRWSLSNLVFSIDRAQFIQLASDFRNAAEASFGTACTLELTLMGAPKVTSSFYDFDAAARIKEVNEAQTLAKSYSLLGLSDDIWAKAAYAEVSIRPAKATEGVSMNAWAHISYSNEHPNTVNYYIQGEKEERMTERLLEKNGYLQRKF